MAENEHTTRTFVSLIVRGKDLNPQMVTDSIGIFPSRFFKRGDIRKDSKKWPHGYWELESTGFVQSSDLALHLEWMAAKLEPSKTALRMLLNNEDLNTELSCFWILPTGNDNLSLSPELLNRIASLGLKLSFDIYCAD